MSDDLKGDTARAVEFLAAFHRDKPIDMAAFNPETRGPEALSSRHRTTTGWLTGLKFARVAATLIST